VKQTIRLEMTPQKLAAGQTIFRIWRTKTATIRYDTIEEINVDSKAEYTA